jgi:transposase
LNNDAVLAVPPSAAYRARKFARRYRTGLVIACAFAFVLIAAAVISTRQSIRANREAIRERWVMRRTAVINQIRGLLLERGITLRKGRCHVDAALPGILEDASAKLSGALRVLLAQLKLELDHLQMRIDEADAAIKKTAGDNEACRRLVAIPGIGPITATAIIAAIGNGAAFKKGREFAAWLGIVPGEYTTGGKQKLLGISKRGNSYLRKLFVHGARAVLQQSAKQSSGLSAWLAQLTARAHHNVVAVALANKLARMAWAVLAKNESYRPPVLVDVAAA